MDIEKGRPGTLAALNRLVDWPFLRRHSLEEHRTF
jgi:hypothetical protein